MEEIWRDIVIEKKGTVYDYTGLYQVSNLGRVRNSRTGRILKPATNGAAYQFVGLYKDKKEKKFLIHRLVATAFIPNPNNLPVVNHKNENPSDNCVDNLEWCTQTYNANYGTCQERRSEKLKGKPHSEERKQKTAEAHKVKVICLETGQIFDSIKDANKWCNCSISHHLRGNTKSAGKHPETGQRLHWMYYEDWLASAN